MKTIFGVEWPVADTLEVTLVLLFLLVVGLFFFLMWYYLNLKKKQAQEQQYFLYKTKQLGLTAAQTKMLNSIIVMISLRDLRRMLTESSLFESSIESFFEYLDRKGETGESLLPVCRDIVITHEKIYHAATYRKPLDSIREIEKNTLLYFHDDQNRCFIGKVTGAEEQAISLRLLHSHKDNPLPAGSGVDVLIWRTGDAEYTFKTVVVEAAEWYGQTAITGNLFEGKGSAASLRGCDDSLRDFIPDNGQDQTEGGRGRTAGGEDLAGDDL